MVTATSKQLRAVKLVLVAEGDIVGVRTFKTLEERAAFEDGYTTGASNYGAGSAYGVYVDTPCASDDDAKNEAREVIKSGGLW